MDMKQYDVEEYETITGKTPFGEWLLNLKDERAQAKIRARIRRASFGETLEIGKISRALREFLRCANITVLVIESFTLL